jgi:hypothetical protein
MPTYARKDAATMLREHLMREMVRRWYEGNVLTWHEAGQDHSLKLADALADRLRAEEILEQVERAADVLIDRFLKTGCGVKRAAAAMTSANMLRSHLNRADGLELLSGIPFPLTRPKAERTER